MKYKIIVIPMDEKFTYRIESENIVSDLIVQEANPFFGTKERAIDFARTQIFKFIPEIKGEDIIVQN